MRRAVALSLRILLVDVALPARRRRAGPRGARAGRARRGTSRAPTASPPRLLRRGWDAVLYGGEGRAPCRRARRSRSCASPTRISRSSPSRRSVRAGDLSAVDPAASSADVVARAGPGAACRALLDARARRRGARGAGRAAGAPAPARPAGDHRPRRGRPRARRAVRARARRRSARRSAGPTAPSGGPTATAATLRCAATWHDAGAGPQVAALRRGLAPA